MIELRLALLVAALTAPAIPALAADAPATPAARAALPAQLSPSQRTDYKAIFDAIQASDWGAAAARISAIGDGPLHNAARAELYLAAGSPRVELDQLLTLLARAPELPHAGQLARLAKTRGAEVLPDLPHAQGLVSVAGPPRRARARMIKGDPVAAELENLINPLIVEDQPGQAEALLQPKEFELSPEALTEFQQRIAWSYYLVGDNTAARRLAGKARMGTGEWIVHAQWVAGLAAWRMQDCAAATEAFSDVASRSADVELMAAGHYWAARADMLCKRPERVQARLRSAARLNETFYGLLAASALGMDDKAAIRAGAPDEWRSVAHRPNVKAALALAEIGESGLADMFIKHQARIGGSSEHRPLLRLAEAVNLATTQIWLSHNAPRGVTVAPADRYPAPDWRPTRGWRVDRSLAYAHALQESNFRTHVVSPAGATGLMQVRPGTAGDLARARGEPFEPRQLTNPSSNLEFGQSYMEKLRDDRGTGGLLPKVIAAYNAGPAPISVWNTRQMDGGDPLLYIESIPYWETRGYVPIVLRNYWMYEQKAGKDSASRDALVQGMWPKFPGMPGPTAVRLTAPMQRPISAGTE